MRWMESGGRRVEVVGSMRSIASRGYTGSLDSLLFLQFELVVYWHSNFQGVVKFDLCAQMARSSLSEYAVIGDMFEIAHGGVR